MRKYFHGYLQCAQYARLNQWAANTPGPSRKSVDWLRPVFQTFSSRPFAYLERVGNFRSKCSPKYRPSIHVHQACFQSFVSPVVLWLIFIIETIIWERKPRKTHRSAVSRRETEKRRNLTQLWRNGELNELVTRTKKLSLTFQTEVSKVKMFKNHHKKYSWRIP